MLDFRIIDISDKERICSCLEKSDFQGCEYSFANNMAWRRLSNSRIAFYKNFYISCAFDTDDNIPLFLFPSGEGNYKEVIDEMKLYAESLGKPLKISGVTQNGLEFMKSLYSGEFTVEFDRDSFPIIYIIPPTLLIFPEESIIRKEIIFQKSISITGISP